jgi:hypothetical protein
MYAYYQPANNKPDERTTNWNDVNPKCDDTWPSRQTNIKGMKERFYTYICLTLYLLNICVILNFSLIFFSILNRKKKKTVFIYLYI